MCHLMSRCENCNICVNNGNYCVRFQPRDYIKYFEKSALRYQLWPLFSPLIFDENASFLEFEFRLRVQFKKPILKAWSFFDFIAVLIPQVRALKSDQNDSSSLDAKDTSLENESRNQFRTLIRPMLSLCDVTIFCFVNEKIKKYMYLEQKF